MDEFEKIRAFSQELSQKAESSLAEENQVQTDASIEGNVPADQDNAEFLRDWNAPTPVSQKQSANLTKTFWMIAGLASCVLVGLLVVIYLCLKSPMENQEIISIPPTQTPVKVKPENPGGMVIPDQDKVIYSRLSQEAVPVTVEKLFPEEQPILPPTVTTTAEENINPDKKELDQPTEVDPVIILADKPIEPAIKEPVKEVPVPTLNSQPVKVATSPKKEEAIIWRVQLFSSSNKDTVEKTWKTVLKKHKDLVSDMPMRIETAEISGKGKFYRLQVGEFSTKERASNLCAKLKKQKQDCIAVK